MPEEVGEQVKKTVKVREVNESYFLVLVKENLCRTDLVVSTGFIGVHSVSVPVLLLEIEGKVVG